VNSESPIKVQTTFQEHDGQWLVGCIEDPHQYADVVALANAHRISASGIGFGDTPVV
jgi:hypothetical protein